MALNSSIFRAYDIRGIYPEEINEATAYQIGRAFAIYLKRNESEKIDQIIVGKDARLSSPILARSFIKGIIDNGINVLDIGLVTVDMIYFASVTMHLPAAMITSSHNPKEWNGFKLMKQDAEVIGIDSGLEDIKSIILEVKKESRDIKQGITIEKSISGDFLKHVMNFVDPHSLRPMRIAIDASSGSSGPILKKVLEKLPVEYIAINFDPDGSFPYHDPDPTKEKNLETLIGKVKTHHYHFGCAFDGDGDRIIFVDDNGEMVSPSIIGAIMAEHFLKNHPSEKVVYGVVVSRIVPDIINLYGGIAIREKVGYQNIRKRLKKIGGILGIETSGHYYFKDNFYVDSGIVSLIIMLGILSRQKKSLSALTSKFNKYFSITELHFNVSNPDEFIKKIAQNFEGYDIDWLDGLTVTTPDFWLNLRPSNTEPLLRLNIEAKDEIILGRVKKDLINLIKREEASV